MKKVVMILAAVPVLFGLSAAAQAPPPQPTAAERAAQAQAAIEAAKAPPVEDFKASDLNQKGKPFPAVNSERRIRARVVAPDAQSVALDIGAVKYPLTKGADGAWVGTSIPQDEGFHYYQIVVDGAQVPDPGSLYFYGASRWGSGLEVPARDQEFYASEERPSRPVARDPVLFQALRCRAPLLRLHSSGL